MRPKGDLLIEGMSTEDLPMSPTRFIPVKRFWECLEVLLEFMESEIPPQIVVRSTTSLLVVYVFGDASGSGFGNSLLIQGQVQYRIGFWG